MPDKCVQCTNTERSNQHRLKPLLFPITYESSEIIGNLNLPRKYTSTHNDITSEIYLSIGHQYNKLLLSSTEARVNQSAVTGKWIKTNNKYEIHLKVYVATRENPNAALRNKIICSELGVVLEGIALAEACLLEQNPHLGQTRILIHFKSIDEKYDRVENWHRLKYWTKDYASKTISTPNKETKIEKPLYFQYGSDDEKDNKKDEKKKKKQHHQRRPPQMCAACRK